MPPDELNNAPNPQDQQENPWPWWLWVLFAGLFFVYAFGPAVAPAVYQSSDEKFISVISDVLDNNYHSPSSLNYSKLYNAALQGVTEELKAKGIIVKPIKLNLRWSRE